MNLFPFLESLRATIGPCLTRPAELQVGALCLRRILGKQEILLISSLTTGRWILPKGWPMDGRSLADAALIEAWEEAGVRGEVDPQPIGHYSYQKMRGNGLPVRCDVQVFPVTHVRLADDFPEAGRRRRKWVTPRKAAGMVAEPELKEFLGRL